MNYGRRWWIFPYGAIQISVLFHWSRIFEQWIFSGLISRLYFNYLIHLSIPHTVSYRECQEQHPVMMRTNTLTYFSKKLKVGKSCVDTIIFRRTGIASLGYRVAPWRQEIIYFRLTLNKRFQKREIRKSARSEWLSNSSFLKRVFWERATQKVWQSQYS